MYLFNVVGLGVLGGLFCICIDLWSWLMGWWFEWLVIVVEDVVLCVGVRLLGFFGIIDVSNNYGGIFWFGNRWGF